MVLARELLSIMSSFGAFVLTMGEQRENDNIKIALEFYPHIYSLNFVNLINEVEINVKSK